MIKIYTFASHREDFIGLQKYSFDKHLQEDYEFTVFNNAHLHENKSKYTPINEAARQAQVPVIDVQRDAALEARCESVETVCKMFNQWKAFSNANVAHAYSLCWAWDNVISKERVPVAILDSDVFLINPAKLTDTLAAHHVCGIPDGRRRDSFEVHYFWPTFLLLNMATLPAPETVFWYCGQVDGLHVDVGGQFYHYCQANPGLDLHSIPYKHFSENDPTHGYAFTHDKFYLAGATALHYRSGSNWDHKPAEYHRQKTEWLKKEIG